MDTFHAHVSIDGATPELHDASAGLPGGQRRAVRAVRLLLEHGPAPSVVTPENEDSFPDFLEQIAELLGVPSVRVTSVVPTGAAAAAGGGASTATRCAGRPRSSETPR